MVRLIASVRPAALAAALVAVALAGDVRLAAAEPAAAPSVDEYRKLIWKRQFGSSEYDAARGVATDADGNVLVTGITQGPLGGAYEGGYFDAFVAKYTAGGDRLWLRHLGTSEEDGSAGVATDAAGGARSRGLIKVSAPTPTSPSTTPVVIFSGSASSARATPTL